MPAQGQRSATLGNPIPELIPSLKGMHKDHALTGILMCIPFRDGVLGAYYPGCRFANPGLACGTPLVFSETIDWKLPLLLRLCRLGDRISARDAYSAAKSRQISPFPRHHQGRLAPTLVGGAIRCELRYSGSGQEMTR